MNENKELQLALQYKQLAYARMALHYYTIYEMWDEGYLDNPFTNYQTEMNQLNYVIPKLLNNEDNTELLETIRSIRQFIMKQMECLTSYTDCLQIYEYLLNRLEFRFEEYEEVEPMKLAEELFQFIFSDQDKSMVYDKLSLVLSQLPIRMTKSRFYDMIRECLSIYSGTSKDALDGFVYNLKQLSMLMSIPEQEEFKPIQQFLLKCKEINDKEISQQEFKQIQDEFIDISSHIETCVNGYMQLQELCNVCNVIALTNPIVEVDTSHIDVSRNICYKIYHLFQGHGTMEEVVELLGQLEGVQEYGIEQVVVLEATIPDKDSVLSECELLMGSSIFVDPFLKHDNTEVNEGYLQQVTEQIIADFKEGMKNNSKMINRAIMATILGNIPNTFTSQQEIYDYLVYSLNNATQEELKATKILLTPLIMEE